MLPCLDRSGLVPLDVPRVFALCWIFLFCCVCIDCMLYSEEDIRGFKQRVRVWEGAIMEAVAEKLVVAMLLLLEGGRWAVMLLY